MGESGFEKSSERIVLPDDAGLKRRLSMKLDEYRKRASDNRLHGIQVTPRDLAYVAPEVLMDYDTSSKSEVLEKLLNDGFVDLEAVLNSNPDSRRTQSLKNAFDVIKSYAEEGGVGLEGGTGLPEVENEGTE